MTANYYTTSLNTAPFEVTRYANGENVDFCVKAKRASSAIAGLAGIGFSVFWLLISGGIASAFFAPLLFGKSVNFKLNGKSVTASLDNFEPLITPAAIIGVFLLIGLVIFIFSLFSLFKAGPWWLATPQRLIEIYKDESKSFDWEQFTGSTTVKGNNLTLEMRTGRMVSRKHGPSRYVPDRVYMIGIPDAFNVEQLCRRRIKEHDPTPANAGTTGVGNIV